MQILHVFIAIYVLVLIKTSSGALPQQQVGYTLNRWKAVFTPNKLEVHMDTKVQVFLELMNVDTSHVNYYFRIISKNPELATVDQIIYPNNIDPVTSSWRGNTTINTIFLGKTSIFVQLYSTSTNTSENSSDTLELTIIRKQRIIDHVFTGSVILLVSLLYINFGAALDLTVLRELITRPVGPVICFIGQFVLMPLISYGLGCAIFPGDVEMQLGLFFTGVSPSGGASNIWSVILGGNINLSVLMTTLSNIAAFGMMPLWIFTLGHLIFDRGNLHVPYSNIATFAVGLVIPLSIGVAIQKCSPRLTRILVRLLKPISTCLILFIIIFAIATNLYLFQLFSWQIVVSGLGLPWLGYVISWCVAKSCRQSNENALTIAIETGIQNTAIAIFLLRLSLPQPEADLTTVIPVSVAIMTPIPLLALHIYKRCFEHKTKEGYRVEDVQNIVQHES